METRANYILIGLFSILSAIAAAIFTVWIANTGFDRQYSQYDVVFDGPVRGLEVGGEVRFNGIQVGDVTTLALDRDDPSKVVARIRVNTDTPIRTGSVAQLDPAGLTGLAYIQISAGDPAKEPLLRPGLVGSVPRIKSTRGQLDRLFQGGEGVISTTLATLAQVNKLLDDRNLQSIARTLQNIEATTARTQAAVEAVSAAGVEVAAVSRAFGGTAAQFSNAASTYDALGRQLAGDARALSQETTTFLSAGTLLANSLRDDVNSVAGGAELVAARAVTTLANADKTLETFNKTATELQALSADLSRTTEDVSTTSRTIDAFFRIGVEQTLPDMSRAAQEVRNTAMTFDALGQRLERQPISDFLAPPPAPTVEWKR